MAGVAGDIFYLGQAAMAHQINKMMRKKAIRII